MSPLRKDIALLIVPLLPVELKNLNSGIHLMKLVMMLSQEICCRIKLYLILIFQKAFLTQSIYPAVNIYPVVNNIAFRSHTPFH